MNAWRPGLPLRYALSPPGGYESDNEDDGEQNCKLSNTLRDIWTDSVSDEGALVDEVTTYRVPGTFEVEDDVDSQTPDQGPYDPAMFENEDLKSQLVTHNPWRTLVRFRTPLKQEELSVYSRFPILRMPTELLLVVAEFLPIESIACLALACKATYFALGTGSFKMPEPNLWKFLLLIEHERQNSFACCRCLTLHRPPESIAHSRYRCCRNSSWRRHVSLDMNLPESITPGLVKMIGRKYFEDPRACLEYLSWASMSTKKKTTRYIKLATHVIPRMLDGSLVLRTETYIHAFVDGHLTQRSLVELAKVVREFGYLPSGVRAPDLCSHQEWKSHLPNIAALKDSITPASCGEGNDHYHRVQCYSNEKIMRTTFQGREYPVEMCDLIHHQPCQSWKLEVPATRTRVVKDKESRQACRPKLEDLYDGEIKGCTKCTTDFCISAREVPGVGCCLVLTTWKDLGGVGVGFSDKWDHHVRNSRRLFSEDRGDIRSQDQVGQAYEAFENLERSGLGIPQRYRPQPERKMIRDLTRRVQKLSHRMDDTTDTEAGTEFEEDDEDSL